MTPILLTGPEMEPVSLIEAKQWLRLDDNREDELVAALLASARLIVETATRRVLITQSWRLLLDCWPRVAIDDDRSRFGPITVIAPLAPLQRVDAINVVDEGGVERAVAPSSYLVEATPDRARVVFTTDPPTPGVTVAGIQVDIVVGYGATPATVPEPLRLAIKMLAARWFENRGDVETNSAADRLPGAIGALIAPYRRARLI